MFWKTLAVTLVCMFAYQSEAQEDYPLDQFRSDKVSFCQDVLFYNYQKHTGIQLTAAYSNYVETDIGAEVTGLAHSLDDERLTGVLHFKCVYRDFMGETMMLTDFDLTEVESE
jgi:hypothetical protein